MDEIEMANLKLKGEVTAENVYLTLLAIKIMRTEYAEADQARSMSLLITRALKWLKSVGLKNPEAIMRAFRLSIKMPAPRYSFQVIC